MESVPLGENSTTASFARGIAEIAGITLVFALLSWSPPPDVNEAHYLCKAKHFWTSQYCEGDLFLDSANAHWLFFASFGIIANACSLETTAWIGRLICWLTLAVGWRHLQRQLSAPSWWIVMSAGLFVILNQLGHLAGEWAVGGAEAKCVAYGLAFFALGDLLQRKHVRGFVALGFAVAFHGLVGLWSTVALIFAVILDDRKRFDLRFACGATLFLLIAATSIWPALSMNSQATAEQLHQGFQLQVFERLDHHQYLFSFAPQRFFSFVVLLACWFLIACEAYKVRRHRLIQNVALGSLVVALGGVACSVAESANLLRFYWFRLADVMIPLSVCVSLPVFLRARIEASYFQEDPAARRQVMQFFKIGVATVVALFICWHSWNIVADGRPGSDRQSLPNYPTDGKRTYETYLNWVKVCHWIKENLPHDAVCVTPIHQQSFKWYAERAEVVCWKDAPQDVLGLLEWNARMELPRSIQGTGYGLLYVTDDELARYAESYGAQYIVTPQRGWELRTADGDPVRFELVYPASADTRSTYVVLKIR